MSLPRLIALTPGDLAGPRDLRFLGRLESALSAGLPGLLVREPALADRALIELVERIAGLAGPELWLVLHDRAHLAASLPVDGLHLGFRSLSVQCVRSSFPEITTVGLSTHADDERALWEGADYLFHGPVRATPSKAGWKEPTGFSGLERACDEGRNVYALGGMGPGDVAPALRVGARGVAVLSGILGNAAAGARTRAYREALDGFK